MTAGTGAAALWLGFQRPRVHPDLDLFINEVMKETHIPGLSACIVKSGKLAWAKGYGWANIERKIPMTPDTLMNVASITKTVTATAVMQLSEQGKFNLDEDVNQYLPFHVANPFHSNQAITVKQLLTHTSSIRDGSAYDRSYACGDPTIQLGAWLQAYLTPGGSQYSESENFYDYRPGDRWNYSNIGFGVLGYLAERVSGTSFARYTEANIFAPLRMRYTRWYLAALDPSRHAVPYTYVVTGDHENVRLKALNWTAGNRDTNVHVPHCLYSFPNLPDGLMRTTASDLARFLIAYSKDGALGDKRILRAGTIREMLRDQLPEIALPDSWVVIQGLAWMAERLRNKELVWGHKGGDPGISTKMLFRPDDGVGTIVFANAEDSEAVADGVRSITLQLFERAADF